MGTFIAVPFNELFTTFGGVGFCLGCGVAWDFNGVGSSVGNGIAWICYLGGDAIFYECSRGLVGLFDGGTSVRVSLCGGGGNNARVSLVWDFS